jgi:hypothetical protein
VAERELALAERAAADGRDEDAVAHARVAHRRADAAAADADATLALRRQAAAASELASVRARWRASAAAKPTAGPQAEIVAPNAPDPGGAGGEWEGSGVSPQTNAGGPGTSATVSPPRTRPPE